MFTFKDFENGLFQVEFSGVPLEKKRDFFQLLADKGYQWSTGHSPLKMQCDKVFHAGEKMLLYNRKTLPVVNYYDIIDFNDNLNLDMDAEYKSLMGVCDFE